MVSARYSAFPSFVRDSFGDNKTDPLDQTKVAARLLVVVPGPRAALAAVVRGTPPHELQTKLQETIETIHLRLGKFFDNFAGDTAPFVAAGPYMEGCLISQQRDEEKAPLALRVATAVMLVVLGWWIFDSLRDARRWNEYLRLLAAEPGLVVVSAERGWGKHSLVGLRDPLSNDPMEILSSKTDIDPTTVTSRWEPYQALLPKFIVMRAKSLLQPPPEVTLSFENGILYAKGPMSAEWLADSSRLAKSLPGVSVLQRGESLESVLERVRGPIEGTRVKFASNQSDPLPGEEAKLDALALQLQEVAAASMRAVHPARLQVDGYADPTGTEAGNMTLSENRAKKIREILIPKIGSPPLEIVATGHGAQTGKEHDESYDKASARRVTLHVVQSSVERKGR